MVVVAALFGVVAGSPASLVAGTVGSRRAVSQIWLRYVVAPS